MKSGKYLRSFIRQVILESSGTPSADSLAVYLPELYSDFATAIIYDTGALLQNLESLQKITFNNPNYLDRVFLIRDVFIEHILKGFLQAGKPLERDGKCNGAWQVFKSAGPGIGKILYSVGYALSPNGQLFPDRGSVSTDAQAAWGKVFGGSRRRKRFDDVKHQHDSINDYHTDDPNDDCKIYKGAEAMYLNHSFESEGWEASVLSQLKANHKETIGKIKQLAPDLDDVEHLLNDARNDFFSKHYNSAGSLANY
jgi:hypothetical protein